MSPSTPPRLVFYFDYSSPFAYLGSTQVERVARDGGAALVLHPILLGGLFRAIGTPNVPLFEMNLPKQRYIRRDMDHWALHWGVPLRFPSRFPMNTVAALRLTLAAPDERRLALVHAIFRAYWADDRDIADPAVLEAVAASVDLDGAALLAAAQSPEVKSRLRDLTDEAARAGVFGVPSFAVVDELFWGQDRLDFVADALLQAARSGAHT